MRQKNTPNDPQRRERIISATMTLLAEAGVGAVTARAVAGQIGIPVGSVSYHFSSVQALLLEASRRVIALRAQHLEEWRIDVTAENVIDRLARLIHHQLTTGRQLTIVAYELYILGLRHEEFRAISSQSIPLLRDTLSDFVPRAEAIRLAAAADGYQLESLFDPIPPTVEDLRAALRG
jgi:TetR/AcrR family transcriptional regulator, regulator of biofilm formation and stress response